MSDDRPTPPPFRWRDTFPWLLLLDCPAAAASLGALLLAALGLSATALGWWLAHQVFLGGQAVTTPATTGLASIPLAPFSWQQVFLGPPAVWESVIAPWRTVLKGVAGVATIAYAVFSLLWLILVWAVCGGAICRIAAEKLGRQARLTVVAAWRHGQEQLPRRLAALSMPVGGGLLIGAGIAIVSIPAVWSWGAVFTGLVGIFVLPFAALGTLLLVGAGLSWPLMWACLAVEREDDGFDAFSRGFAFTFQRPLHFALYSVVAAALGAAAWLAFWSGGWVMDQCYVHALALGAGATRASQLLEAATLEGWSDTVGASLLRFWRGIIWLLVASYGVAYFWHAALAIYLLLRSDLDGEEIDEISLGDEAGGQLSLPQAVSGQAAHPTEPGDIAEQTSGRV